MIGSSRFSDRGPEKQVFPLSHKVCVDPGATCWKDRGILQWSKIGVRPLLPHDADFQQFLSVDYLMLTRTETMSRMKAWLQ